MQQRQQLLRSASGAAERAGCFDATPEHQNVDSLSGLPHPPTVTTIMFSILVNGFWKSAHFPLLVDSLSVAAKLLSCDPWVCLKMGTSFGAGFPFGFHLKPTKTGFPILRQTPVAMGKKRPALDIHYHP